MLKSSKDLAAKKELAVKKKNTIKLKSNEENSGKTVVMNNGKPNAVMTSFFQVTKEFPEEIMSEKAIELTLWSLVKDMSAARFVFTFGNGENYGGVNIAFSGDL
jgi:hypothetical protein